MNVADLVTLSEPDRTGEPRAEEGVDALSYRGRGSRLTSLPEPLKQLDVAPIFVVGNPRSGTTWVLDILRQHPEVAAIHESYLFSPQDGLAALFNRSGWMERHRGLGTLMTREELIADVRELAARWLARTLEPGHRFLIEKSPATHLYVMELIAEIFPEARFIHVLRDGRDVAVSVRAASRSWAPRWKKSFGRSMLRTARVWRNAVRIARNSGNKLGDRFMEIRYEEIKGDPLGASRRLLEFCGIPYDDQLLQEIYEATDFKQQFQGGEDQFRRAGRIGDWRKSFTVLDCAIFNVAGGDVLVEAGYVRNRLWCTPD